MVIREKDGNNLVDVKDIVKWGCGSQSLQMFYVLSGKVKKIGSTILFTGTSNIKLEEKKHRVGKKKRKKKQQKAGREPYRY